MVLSVGPGSGKPDGKKQGKECLLTPMLCVSVIYSCIFSGERVHGFHQIPKGISDHNFRSPYS